MPKIATQDTTTPAPIATQDTTTPAPIATQDTTTPDVAKQLADLQNQLAEAVAAKEDAELKAAEAEQAAAIAKREEEAKVEIDPEDKKVLDALDEGKSAELVADKLGLEVPVVVRVAYENMNGESVYDLAARLGVKVNDIYKATDQPHLVRMIQYVDDEGRRKQKELDYEVQ